MKKQTEDDKAKRKDFANTVVESNSDVSDTESNNSKDNQPNNLPLSVTADSNYESYAIFRNAADDILADGVTTYDGIENVNIKDLYRKYKDPLEFRVDKLNKELDSNKEHIRELNTNKSSIICPENSYNKIRILNL